MLNKKLIIHGVIFFCFSISVFPQDVSIGLTRGDAFINHFFWYHKYLPQENTPELYTLRNILVLSKENDREEFELLNSALDEIFYDFDNKVFSKIQEEIVQKNNKMDALMNLDESDAETAKIQELSLQYAGFKTIIEERNYPKNDLCLDVIEEYYSRLITRRGYARLNQGDPSVSRRPGTDLANPELNDYHVYTVNPGDYLRKIAAFFYNSERYWRLIYNANKDVLPKPNNPDLIYPRTVLRIPALTAE